MASSGLANWAEAETETSEAARASETMTGVFMGWKLLVVVKRAGVA
jgi:hypothetical protein